MNSRLQLTGEKLDLVAYQRFEGLAEVEVEMAGVVALDFAPGCGMRVSERLGRRRDAVGITDTEQDWEFDLLRHPPRSVGSDGRSDPRRYLVPEGRLGWQQRLIPGKGVRGVHQGQRPGWAGERDHRGRPAQDLGRKVFRD